MQRIILLGAPGSGKSTQGQLLAEYLGVSWVSTGELFRQSADPAVQAQLQTAKLFDDQQVYELLHQRLTEVGGAVIDGFPRTAAQAELLPRLEVDAIYEIVVPEAEIKERLSQRGRTQDAAAVVQERLQTYLENRAAIANILQQQGYHMAQVDGLGTVEEVQARLRAAVSGDLPAEVEAEAAGPESPVEQPAGPENPAAPRLTLIYGPAGSGKSTQGQLLAERLGRQWLSAGQIIRDSGQFEQFTSRAGWIPEDTLLDLISAEVAKAGKDVVFDGQPGSPQQIEQWRRTGLLPRVERIIILDVPREESLRRLAERGRADDNAANWQSKLDDFEQKIYTFLQPFADAGVKIVHVNGEGEISEVAERISQIIV